MSHRDRRGRTHGDEGGFTLVEMIVAITIGAFVFAALGGAMAGGLRALAVQKARTQGNEVATQGIEDLQRYTFDKLGLCSPPPGTAPSGLGTMVQAPVCPADLTNYGEDPCNAVHASDAPSPYYTCTRLNVAFRVRRYIAWTDAGQTAKRLAVYVDWSDSVGNHTVSQQSSLRSPSTTSVIGLYPPTLSAASVNPGTSLIDTAGQLVTSASISVSVNATNLSTSDRVFALFNTLDASGNPVSSSYELTPQSGGASWTGSLDRSNGFTFGKGSQFITFNTVRVSDGKTNSVISSAVKFCPYPADSTCSSTALPSFTSWVTPGSVSLDSSGAQTADFTVSAVTKNITVTDTVQVLLPTLSGVQTVSLVPNTSTCTTSSCTWTTVISKQAGYAFASGSRPFDFTALQALVAGSAVDTGSTASATSSNVSFG